MGICVKRKGETMKCPHCQVAIHEDFTRCAVVYAAGANPFIALNGAKKNARWDIRFMACPACNKGIMYLDQRETKTGILLARELIVPKFAGRPKAPQEVPPWIAEDFNEACLVLSDSPKASAALSRRCLQGVLRDKGFSQHDLAKAIDAIIASKQLPTFLASSVDAIRVVGNFAAHPSKDTQSGEILPVEPDEASWNLDVLEGLFDFYYVAPEREKAKIDAMNAKLLAAGKPEMKKG